MKKLIIALSLLLCSCAAKQEVTTTTVETTVSTEVETTVAEEETTVVETEAQKNLEDLVLSSVFDRLQEKIPSLTEYQIFDSSSDPNGLLGRPKQYIQKADGWDSRKEVFDKEGDYAIDIEVFKNKADCQSRYEYLQQFTDPNLGIMGLNQYMYKYDLAIFRVDYDLTPEAAEEYKQAMDEIIGEVSVQYE